MIRFFKNIKRTIWISIFVLGIFAVGVSTVFGTLTLNNTAVTSDGALTFTGTGASTWDIGANTLSLQTTGNGAITTGSGLFTTGGAMTVGGALTANGNVFIGSGKNILLTAGQNLDVAAAGALNIGTATSTSINIGTGPTANAVTIGNNIASSTLSIKTADITFVGGASGAHIGVSQTTAPTISTSTTILGNPTSAVSVAAGSTDTAGKFTFTSGNDGTFGTGVVAIVTFDTTYGAAPKMVLLTPASTGAAARQAYISSVSSTSFNVGIDVAVASSTAYSYNYMVIR